MRKEAIFQSALSSAASLKFSLWNLSLAMVLVVIGTIAQLHTGTIDVQEKFFQTFFVVWQPPHSSMKIPVFFGGYCLGIFFLLNLFASTLLQKRYSLKKLGVYLIHLGLLFLLLGETLGGIFSTEAMLFLKKGQKANFALDLKNTELAIQRPESSQEIVLSTEHLQEGSPWSHPNLPFSLLVKKKLPNARIEQRESEKKDPIATEGVGPLLSVDPIPIARADNEINFTTAWVELFDEKKSQGIWLLSSAIEEEQPFQIQGQTYRFAIRPKRIYLPFWVRLLNFKQQLHPGSSIPKHFSSLVQIESPLVPLSSTLISMNDPLRIQGYTIYQSGFANDETESILKVVSNPASFTPYIFSFLVILGFVFLLIQRARPKKAI